MPKRILLADDSITIQKVVELTFSDGDYEVTAVNNGTKAIQKLSEMRPDIILSDIIMPEKNGYEVCEYVKSHPEYRSIPVVLLTGTFEPFDPDRADKAGCDAVVTKPFESQSLIHKVEELIEHARAGAPTSPPIAMPAAAAAPTAPADSPFAPPADNFSTSALQSSNNDIFSASPAAAPAPAPPAGETPFDFGGPTTGETKAFPKMSFEDLQQLAAESGAPQPAPPKPAPAPAPPPAAPEPSPWDEPAATGGETRAIPKMSFEDLQPPVSAPDASPWDEPAPGGGETKAFPRMSFDDLKQMANEPAPAPAPPPPTWDAPPAASSAPFESPAAPPAAPMESSSPWDEEPAATGETKAFPRMSFDELHQMAKDESSASAAEEVPFSSPKPAPEPEPTPAAAMESPASSSGPVGDLTEEQIDRIARRVVQLMSEQVVKNIAWEIIPDLAEMVVKERVRQLENEA